MEEITEKQVIRKVFKWTLLLIGLSFLVYVISVPLGLFKKVTNPDHIIQSYEEYEEIYSTCNKICDDMSALNSSNVDNTSGFNKEERALALENQMNRWIREYNAKSREITRNMWKSGDLPYQLSRNNFNCKN